MWRYNKDIYNISELKWKLCAHIRKCSHGSQYEVSKNMKYVVSMGGDKSPGPGWWSTLLSRHLLVPTCVTHTTLYNVPEPVATWSLQRSSNGILGKKTSFGGLALRTNVSQCTALVQINIVQLLDEQQWPTGCTSYPHSSHNLSMPLGLCNVILVNGTAFYLL